MEVKEIEDGKSNFPTFRHFGMGKRGGSAELWNFGFDDFYILYYVYIYYNYNYL